MIITAANATLPAANAKPKLPLEAVCRSVRGSSGGGAMSPVSVAYTPTASMSPTNNASTRHIE